MDQYGLVSCNSPRDVRDRVERRMESAGSAFAEDVSKLVALQ